MGTAALLLLLQNRSATAAQAQLADLVVNQADSPDPGPAGGVFTYTIRIDNNGPNARDRRHAHRYAPAGLDVRWRQRDAGQLYSGWRQRQLRAWRHCVSRQRHGHAAGGAADRRRLDEHGDRRRDDGRSEYVEQPERHRGHDGASGGGHVGDGGRRARSAGSGAEQQLHGDGAQQRPRTRSRRRTRIRFRSRFRRACASGAFRPGPAGRASRRPGTRSCSGSITCTRTAALGGWRQRAGADRSRGRQCLRIDQRRLPGVRVAAGWRHGEQHGRPPRRR